MQEAYKFIEENLTNGKTIVTWRPSRDTVKKSEHRDREHVKPCHSLLECVYWEMRSKSHMGLSSHQSSWFAHFFVHEKGHEGHTLYKEALLILASVVQVYDA